MWEIFLARPAITSLPNPWTGNLSEKEWCVRGFYPEGEVVGRGWWCSGDRQWDGVVECWMVEYQAVFMKGKSVNDWLLQLWWCVWGCPILSVRLTGCGIIVRCWNRLRLVWVEWLNLVVFKVTWYWTKLFQLGFSQRSALSSLLFLVLFQRPSDGFGWGRIRVTIFEDDASARSKRKGGRRSRWSSTYTHVSRVVMTLFV